MIALTGRERAAVARVVQGAVQPGDDLPPVARTDSVAAFAAFLAAAPGPARLLLRALLPLAARRPQAATGPAALVARLAASCYYGDVEVMRRLGFDAPAIAARGARARARPEGHLP